MWSPHATVRKMTLAVKRASAAILAFAMAAYEVKVSAQVSPSNTDERSQAAQPSVAPFPALPNSDLSFSIPVPASALLTLLEFKTSDIKFKLDTLMKILRDPKHESWVLAAYPDPKTNRPLIGAGFSLDVKASVHLQRNPLNPHQFVEPSAAQLWQAAGLDLERLQVILDQFDRDLGRWTKKEFVEKIRAHDLPPELTDEEATRLLRLSALQAIYNARAYCTDFDQLTAWQQMALSQLVFQMGVNLEEFVQFLSAINNYYTSHELSSGELAIDWKTVQHTLIQSDWARRYANRAATVIAMFDPNYDKNPKATECTVQAQIRPLVHRAAARRHRNALCVVQCGRIQCQGRKRPARAVRLKPSERKNS